MSRKFDTKLMKIADDFADFDLMKPKTRPSPRFRSQETDSMFIVTMQLKEYTRPDIKVEINEDGSVITISGEKPIQDMLMVGGQVVKKDIEMRGLRKSFKVPQGVVLDEVRVWFNEDDLELVIRMPKATTGVIGVEAEELDTNEIISEFTKPLRVYTEEELKEQESQEKEKGKRGEEKLPRKGFKICSSVIFGSAFFMSLIILVFRFVQSEKPVEKEKKKNQD